MSDDDSPTGHADQPTVEHRPPADAFALLGNETRIDIVRALTGSPNDSLPFSELKDRVGTRDSGQFNYHLDKLTDTFLRKTDDGYQLTVAGVLVAGALRAGFYTADASIEPIELESACPDCAGPIVVTYEDEHVRMECRECAEFGNQYPFPPGTIEQFDRDQLPLVFDRWLGTWLRTMIAGFCPICSGSIDGRLDHDGESSDISIDYVCEHCGSVAWFPPQVMILDHPAAQAFYYDHGIDVRRTPAWELERLTEVDTELLDTDPPSVRVELDLEADRLVATIDESASVESIERIGPDSGRDG